MCIPWSTTCIHFSHIYVYKYAFLRLSYIFLWHLCIVWWISGKPGVKADIHTHIHACTHRNAHTHTHTYVCTYIYIPHRSNVSYHPLARRVSRLARRASRLVRRENNELPVCFRRARQIHHATCMYGITVNQFVRLGCDEKQSAIEISLMIFGRHSLVKPKRVYLHVQMAIFILHSNFTARVYERNFQQSICVVWLMTLLISSRIIVKN